MTPKRKKIQDFVLKIILKQDPSGYNSRIYEDMFAAMSDTEFEAWGKSLKENPHHKFNLIVPPLKTVITPEASFATAKLLGVKFLERLRLWDPTGKRSCLTPHEYFVVKLPVRRLKQYLYDGLSLPDSDKRLNPLTDQVVKPDKGSAISYPQAQMIAEKGLDKVVHELITIRGGDTEAYAKMKSEIEETGTSSTSVMEGTRGVRSAQTLRTILNGMHLETNL